MQLYLCVLGKKGFSVLDEFIASGLKADIIKVFIGQDSNVQDDFSEDIKRLCIKSEIPFSMSNNFQADSAFNFVMAVGWRWLIREVPENKIIVFHDSLLPRYRGFAPLVNALLNREPEVGVTALFGSVDYDKGNILVQERCRVVYPTTIGAEINRLTELYRNVARVICKRILANTIDGQGSEQNEALASYSLWRDDSDYKINWLATAEDIRHFIDCVGSPFLGATSEMNGQMIRIFKASVVGDVKIENRQVGKIIFVQNGCPIVVCLEGLLRLEDVRALDGKNLLPWGKFRTRFK